MANSYPSTWLVYFCVIRSATVQWKGDLMELIFWGRGRLPSQF